jgi:hypothetical protein
VAVGVTEGENVLLVVAVVASKVLLGVDPDEQPGQYVIVMSVEEEPATNPVDVDAEGDTALVMPVEAGLEVDEAVEAGDTLLELVMSTAVEAIVVSVTVAEVEVEGAGLM